MRVRKVVSQPPTQDESRVSVKPTDEVLFEAVEPKKIATLLLAELTEQGWDRLEEIDKGEGSGGLVLSTLNLLIEDVNDRLEKTSIVLNRNGPEEGAIVTVSSNEHSLVSSRRAGKGKGGEGKVFDHRALQ